MECFQIAKDEDNLYSKKPTKQLVRAECGNCAYNYPSAILPSSPFHGVVEFVEIKMFQLAVVGTLFL
jgi:hypothetical protein